MYRFQRKIEHWGEEKSKTESIYLFDHFARTFHGVGSGNGPREEQMGWTFETCCVVVGLGLFVCLSHL